MSTATSTTDDTVKTTAKFGWCLDGHHTACRVTARGQGVHAGKTLVCGCTCHNDEGAAA